MFLAPHKILAPHKNSFAYADCCGLVSCTIRSLQFKAIASNVTVVENVERHVVSMLNTCYEEVRITDERVLSCESTFAKAESSADSASEMTIRNASHQRHTGGPGGPPTSVTRGV